jgi:hypothetical protein
LLGACGTAGGFSYELIKRITMNSNAYVRSRLVGNKFYGSDWKNITVEEMFHTLGMILKMSLVNIRLGGLKAYFNPLKKLYISCDDMIELSSIETNWTDERLTLKRFLQIRAALHPEIGVSDIGDKCHQLRAAIQSLNQAAKKSFILGRQISFDEGGIASKSRYNPVRQYNASKPDKYRIDFFIMVNATSGMNFIYHLDVYQGKNATNAFIAEEAHDLPTTQKAVVNAIVLSGIANDTDGMREIYMDNRYSAPSLFVLLREKYSILACGTVRSNRTGWNSQILNLPKSSQQGTSLMKFDPINKVLFGQWNDNKVVSFISTLGLFGMSTIQRRVGANKVDLQIPEALKQYSADNFMGGVDNMDKDKKIGGSFTSRALFRKWYRMGLMGIFDFMIVNGRQAWNMSTETKTERFKLDNAKFRWGLAEELLKFKDESAVDFVSEQQLSHRTAMMIAGHQPQSIPNKVKIMCCVCNLERQFRKASSRDNSNNSEAKGTWSVHNIVACSNDNCRQHFHCVQVESSNYIFEMPQFEGLTCFEIAHHKSTNGLWSSNPNFKYKLRGVKETRKNDEKRAYSVMTSHPIYLRLRRKYGLESKKRKRDGPVVDNDDHDNDDHEEEDSESE